MAELYAVGILGTLGYLLSKDEGTKNIPRIKIIIK